MQSLNNPRLRQTSLVLVTIFGMIGIVLFYYFHYVPSLEDRVVSRKFRALRDISSSIDQKFDTYRVWSKEEGIKRIPEQRMDKNTDMDSLSFQDRVKKVRFTAVPVPFIPEFNHSEIIMHQGKWSIRADHIPLDIEAGKDHQWKLKYETQVNDFFKDLLRPIEFDNYIISLTANNEHRGKIIYQQEPTNLTLGVLDTLDYSMEEWAFGASPQIVRINGMDHRILHFPIHVEGRHFLDLYGLISESRFEQEFRGIPYTIFYPTLILSLILLCLIPLLKQIIISPIERVGIYDVSFSIAGLVCATALFSVLLQYVVHREDQYQTNKEWLTELSSQISKDFEWERGWVRSVAMSADMALGTIFSEHRNEYDACDPDYSELLIKEGVEGELEIEEFCEKETNQCCDVAKPSKFDSDWILGLIKNLKLHGTEVKTVSWINGEGMQRYKWTVFDQKHLPKLRVGDRSYFKMIDQKRDLPEGSPLPLFTESIYSRTSASQNVIISTLSEVKDESSNKMVLACSYQSAALFNTKMPRGFKFAIVYQPGQSEWHKNARVLFHSDMNLNMRESLLEEGDRDKMLISALYSNQEQFFSSNYQGKPHSMYTRGLGEGLVLITMVEEDFLDSASILPLMETLALFSGLILYLTVIIILLWMLKKRPSKLRIRTFTFEWLKPQFSHRKRYIQAGVMEFYSIAFLLLAMFFDIGGTEYSDSIFLIFLITTYALIGNMSLINYGTKLRPHLSYLRSVSANRVISFLGFTVLVLGWNWLILTNSKHGGFYITYQVIFWVIYFLLNWKKVKNLLNHCFNGVRYKTAFIVHAFMWLVIVAVLPVLFFGKVAKNDEEKKFAAQVHLDLVQKLGYHNAERFHKEGISTGKYGSYLEFWYKSREEAEDESPHVSEKHPHLIADTTNHATRFMSSMENALNGALAAFRSETYDHIAVHSGNLVYGNEDLMEIKRPDSRSFMLYWLLLIPLLVMAYGVLKFTVNRLFFMPNVRNENEDINDTKSIIANEELRRIIFVGIPRSGRATELNAFIEQGKKVTLHIDTTRVSEDDYFNGKLDQLEKRYADTDNKGFKHVIITEFEYNFENQEIMDRKIRLMEKVNRLYRVKVILCSTMHPMRLQELIQKRIDEYEERLLEKGESNESRQEMQKLIASNRQFIVMLTDYYKLFQRPVKKLDEKEGEKISSVHHFILNECNHGTYLSNLGKVLLKEIEQEPKRWNQNTRESLILRVQSLAHSYYLSIWRGLTQSEKLILFDLAQDSLVNTKNIQPINNLISMGLLRHESGRLKLLNNSFQNFILTVVKPEEAIELERSIKEQGNWSMVRTPIIAVFVFILLFVFIMEPGMFNKTEGLLTGIGAGLTLILRMIAVFAWKKRSTT